jgi:hypothetical protein
MPYIILILGRGIHDSVPKRVDISNIQPFKKALELNVIKKKPLSLSKKQLLCQELKWRNPGKKLNINNKKVDDFFSMLDTEELDEVDKEYVRNEMAMYIDQIKKGVEEVEMRKRDVGQIEMTDQLQYVLAIYLCGDVRECYLRSQDVMDRQALDARNTDAGVTDFHEDFIVQCCFNDTEWVPSTCCAHGSLHSFFIEPIVCPKHEQYTMSREKSKQLRLDMKHKLNEICKRYEKSGNRESRTVRR